MMVSRLTPLACNGSAAFFFPRACISGCVSAVPYQKQPLERRGYGDRISRVVAENATLKKSGQDSPVPSVSYNWARGERGVCPEPVAVSESMDLNYVIGSKTNGANPFKIWERLKTLDQNAIFFAVRRMSYAAFLQTAYWFAVSTVAKSNAGMRCQVCNSPNQIATHHRTYDTHGSEHLNMVDLVVLCDNCHGLFHGHKSTPFIPDRPKMQPIMTSEVRFKVKRPLVIPHSPEDIQIPDVDPIILTKALIDRCRANGSFTNSTLNALGVTRELMVSGWTFRLEGKSLSREQYRKAVEGKFIYRERRARA